MDPIRTGPDAQVSPGVRSIELSHPGKLGSLLSPSVILYYRYLSLSDYSKKEETMTHTASLIALATAAHRVGKCLHDVFSS